MQFKYLQLSQHFQFPLWDTVITKSLFLFVNPLSIPFMGYRVMIQYEFQHESGLSIPFMGYPVTVTFDKPSYRIGFQFPLWDTHLVFLV